MLRNIHVLLTNEDYIKNRNHDGRPYNKYSTEIVKYQCLASECDAYSQISAVRVSKVIVFK